jgi:hypothetical protein
MYIKLELTISQKHIGKPSSISFPHDRRKTRQNGICLFLSIAVGRNLSPKNLVGGKGVIILEIVHKIVRDRRLGANFYLDLVNDDFGLEIGNADLLIGAQLGNSNDSHFCRWEDGERPTISRNILLRSFQRHKAPSYVRWIWSAPGMAWTSGGHSGMHNHRTVVD